MNYFGLSQGKLILDICKITGLESGMNGQMKMGIWAPFMENNGEDGRQKTEQKSTS